MQRWLLAFCLCASFSTFADNVTLIPVYTPKPEFPGLLKSTGSNDTTRVQFVVHSDGSVSDIKILKSGHPLFSKASRKAVEQWRFKPWKVTAQSPASVEVVAPMIFTYTGRPQLPMDINAALGRLSCRGVNAQVAQRNLQRPQTPLEDLSVFAYVLRYVSEGAPSSQLSKTRRTELLDEFTAQIPQIVERCKADPNAFYADQMPASIRALL